MISVSAFQERVHCVTVSIILRNNVKFYLDPTQGDGKDLIRKLKFQANWSQAFSTEAYDIHLQ